MKRQSFKNSGFPHKISLIRERFSISMWNQRDWKSKEIFARWWNSERYQLPPSRIRLFQKPTKTQKRWAQKAISTDEVRKLNMYRVFSDTPRKFLFVVHLQKCVIFEFFILPILTFAKESYQQLSTNMIVTKAFLHFTWKSHRDSYRI